VSFSTIGYMRAGLPLSFSAPLTSIYFSTVALYNPLNQGFNVQNGSNQNVLSPQQAQLFSVTKSGSAIGLQLPFSSAISGLQPGAWLGPIQAVWFEPDESPGSFPTPLGALQGLVQWTPPDTSFTAEPFFIVPSGALISVIFDDVQPGASPTGIDITGQQSGDVVASYSGTPAAGSTITIPVIPNAIDTSYSITSSVDFSATLVLGVSPSVAPAGAP
jgi:hypothetical protein